MLSGLGVAVPLWRTRSTEKGQWSPDRCSSSIYIRKLWASRSRSTMISLWTTTYSYSHGYNEAKPDVISGSDSANSIITNYYYRWLEYLMEVRLRAACRAHGS